jgi:hypothetical protein
MRSCVDDKASAPFMNPAKPESITSCQDEGGTEAVPVQRPYAIALPTGGEQTTANGTVVRQLHRNALY